VVIAEKANYSIIFVFLHGSLLHTKVSIKEEKKKLEIVFFGVVTDVFYPKKALRLPKNIYLMS